MKKIPKTVTLALSAAGAIGLEFAAGGMGASATAGGMMLPIAAVLARFGSTFLGSWFNRDVRDSVADLAAQLERDAALGKLPPNHDIERAAQEAYRDTLLILAEHLEKSGRIRSKGDREWMKALCACLKKLDVKKNPPSSPPAKWPDFSITGENPAEAFRQLWHRQGGGGGVFEKKLGETTGDWFQYFSRETGAAVPLSAMDAVNRGWSVSGSEMRRHSLSSVWAECFRYQIKHSSAASTAHLFETLARMAGDQQEILSRLKGGASDDAGAQEAGVLQGQLVEISQQLESRDRRVLAELAEIKRRIPAPDDLKDFNRRLGELAGRLERSHRKLFWSLGALGVVVALGVGAALWFKTTEGTRQVVDTTKSAFADDRAYLDRISKTYTELQGHLARERLSADELWRRALAQVAAESKIPVRDLEARIAALISAIKADAHADSQDRARLDFVRKAAEESEKAVLEAERKAALAAEKKAIAAEKAALNAEREAITAERAVFETERKALNSERLAVESEKRAAIEAGRKAVEAEKKAVEAGKMAAIEEEKRAAFEAEKTAFESERAAFESERKTILGPRKTAGDAAGQDGGNIDLLDVARTALEERRFSDAADEAGKVFEIAGQNAAEAEALRKAAQEKETGALRLLVDSSKVQGSALVAFGNLGGAVDAYARALEKIAGKSMQGQWADLQILLGRTASAWAARLKGDGAGQRRQQAIDAYRAALKVYTRKDFPREWARTQEYLGRALREQSEITGGAHHNHLLDASIAAYRAALEFYTRDKFPMEWAGVQNSVGIALKSRLITSTGRQRAEFVDEAIDAYRAVQEVYTREKFPKEWVRMQNNIHLLQGSQAMTVIGPERVALLEKAAQTCRASLEVMNRDDFPHDWAMAQKNLGTVLRNQALASGAGAPNVKLLAESARVYRAALEVYTREAFPEDWAATQYNLWITLGAQAGASSGAQRRQLRGEAVQALRAAMELYNRKNTPKSWGRMQNNLGVALMNQSNESKSEQRDQLLDEAVQAFRDALEVKPRRENPLEWPLVQNNLGLALRKQSEARKGAQRASLLKESAALLEEVQKMRADGRQTSARPDENFRSFPDESIGAFF